MTAVKLVFYYTSYLMILKIEVKVPAKIRNIMYKIESYLSYTLEVDLEDKVFSKYFSLN